MACKLSRFPVQPNNMSRASLVLVHCALVPVFVPQINFTSYTDKDHKVVGHADHCRLYRVILVLFVTREYGVVAQICFNLFCYVTFTHLHCQMSAILIPRA